MPRRKYGHMVGACPPTKKEKCRMCRMGKPCPIHKAEETKAPTFDRKKARRGR
jgi:hypothetical protein